MTQAPLPFSLRLHGNYAAMCLLLLFALFASLPAAAQKKAGDMVKIRQLLEQGHEYFKKDKLDSAAFFYQQVITRARAADSKKSIAEGGAAYFKVLSRQGKYKEALELALETVEASKKLGNESLANAYNDAGKMYRYLGNWETSTTYFLKALGIAEALDNKSAQMEYCNNLSSVFGELQDPQKCFEYASRGYQLARQVQDTSGMIRSLINMGGSEIYTKQYVSAGKHYKEALKLGQIIKHLDKVLIVYFNLGELEEEQKNFQGALGYYQQGLQVLHYYPAPLNEMYIHWGLSRTYHQLGMHTEALHYLNKSIATSQTINASNERRQLYRLGSDIHEKMNKPSLALEYRKKFEALNDSLLNAQTQQNIHRLEIEYQTSQKEKEIAQQQLTIANNALELQRKSNFIYLSIALVITLLLLIFLFYLLYLNKQRTHADKLRALKQESEMKVLMAMIEGEEKERSRLARELHDGVGGILSATKMHLSVLKNEPSMVDLSQKFSHTTALLDSASREVRTIAHNLSPDILLKYDLEQALTSFCHSVSNDYLQVDFYYLGEPLKLKNNFKLVLYRIAQELVNNIIKHSGASHALVQLSHHDQFLSLTVEDNGMGFTPQENKGIGLSNMQARVKDMSGQFSLESAIGKGTTVYIEFDVTTFIDHESSLIAAV